MAPPPPPTGGQQTQQQAAPKKSETLQSDFVPANAVHNQRSMRNSIYKVYFPITKSGSDASPRDPMKCIKHILAILSKRCNDLHVLPKDANDSANEPICLWSNFPATKTAADAYLFNIKYPGQNFGNRAGAIDFRAEFRVSCASSVKWMKQNDEVRAELERHRYTVTGRADGPTVRTIPICWLIGPDPDNCSIANLTALLSEHIPDSAFLHLEKHRISCRPDHQRKVFVTHGLKVSAPASAAWSTHKAIRKYLNDTPDEERPVQLRDILYAGINSKDVTKVELAALITLQNKRLNVSAAVQVVNVWKTDTDFVLTDSLVERLSMENLDMKKYKPKSIREYIRSNDTNRVNIRQLMYAVINAREDITVPPVFDDYIRGKAWNLVCDRTEISGVTTFAEWFTGAIEDELSSQTFAQICGCNRPHDPNQYPRVEYAKQYSPDQQNYLQMVYGCALQDFMKEHRIPEEGSPETETPPDFTRPPRETFRPLHHSNMNTLTLSRPSWASTVYESSFDTTEPKKKPYTPKKFTSYAKAVDNTTTNTTQPKNPYNKPSTTRSQTSKQTSDKVPTNTNVSSSTSEPSTLTPPSKSTKRTVVTPTATTTQAPKKSQFVQNTEQKFLDISRDIMEIRNGRQSVITRVAQIEKNQDKLSAQITELSKSTKQLLARLNEPEELQTEPTPAPDESQTSDTDEFITDVEFKKFRKKLESVLEDTFENLHDLIDKKFKNIDTRFDKLEQQTEGMPSTPTNMDVDSDPEIIDDPEPSPRNSAHHSVSTDSSTASGPSPQKKLKGGHGSGEG